MGLILKGPSAPTEEDVNERTLSPTEEVPIACRGPALCCTVSYYRGDRLSHVLRSAQRWRTRCLRPYPAKHIRAGCSEPGPVDEGSARAATVPRHNVLPSITGNKIIRRRVVAQLE